MTYYRYRFLIYKNNKVTPIYNNNPILLMNIRSGYIQRLDPSHTIGVIQQKRDNEWFSIFRYGLEAKGYGHDRSIYQGETYASN